MFRAVQILLVSLVLAAASAQSVTVGLFQDPPDLDPALATATSEYVVLYQVFDTLLTVEDDGTIAPNLATEWEISDDGRTYTFVLRDDVAFHDGTPFNAEAVKFSLERAKTMPAGAFVEQLSNIEAVSALDEYRVEVRLAEAQGSFLTYMTDVSSMPVSPAAASEGGVAFRTSPVGTGPFKFDSRTVQDNITLVANDDYWGGVPKIDQVIFRFFPDGSVRYANLRSGAVDIIYPIESKDYVTAEGNDAFTLLRQPTNGWRVLVLNTARPPFDNVELRRALSQAIDREAINNIVFDGLETPATSPIPPTSPFFTETDAPINADPEQAKKILAEAGIQNPQAVLTAIARSPENQLSQLIQAMAGQAGIQLAIDQVETGEYTRRNPAGEFDAALMQWSGQADPDANVTSFLITDGYWNWSNYSNPQVDELLLEAQRTSDMDARRELYGQVMEIVNSEVPIIWLANQVRLVATTSDLTGVRLMPNTGIMVLKDAEIVD